MKRAVVVALVLALLLVVLLVACKKSSPPPARDAAVGAVADGGAGLGDEPEEADVRAGKRTGLETADATPEVATEDFARALVRGTVSWARVTDPTTGVLELAAAKVEHRCAAALASTTAVFSSGATAVLDDPGLVYDIVCDNIGLAVTIPGVTSHAVCSISSPAGDGLEYDLVFVPDPRLGLRLIGLSTTDALATDDAVRDTFDDALGRYGARCPT